MKKFLIGLFFLTFTTAAFALDNPWNRELPFKKATIHYDIKGNQSGTKTIYIKDYGRSSAEYSNTTMTLFGMTQSQNEVIITTPDWEYHADLQEGTGTKQVNPQKYFIDEFEKLSKSDKKKVIENVEKMGLLGVEGLNGTLEKNAEKVLGYLCDKVTIMGTTAYTISGTELPLKVTANMMGITHTETATKIEKGNPPASKFKLPSGIRFDHDTQADQLIRENARMTIKGLVSGIKPRVTQGQQDGNGEGEISPAQMQQMMQSMQQMLGGQKE